MSRKRGSQGARPVGQASRLRSASQSVSLPQAILLIWAVAVVVIFLLQPTTAETLLAAVSSLIGGGP